AADQGGQGIAGAVGHAHGQRAAEHGEHAGVGEATGTTAGGFDAALVVVEHAQQFGGGVAAIEERLTDVALALFTPARRESRAAKRLGRLALFSWSVGGVRGGRALGEGLARAAFGIIAVRGGRGARRWGPVRVRVGALRPRAPSVTPS